MPDSSLPTHERPPRSPARWVYDLFSGVPLGITLLAILFVYMTIGSAGILYPIHPNIFHPDAWVHAQMRQWRPFEMTEFEWFHWWPFKLLLALIATNIIVTTLRRIRFKPVNFGVWGIHTGVLVLMLGSVIYFGTKVEGDALVLRRRVVATVTSPPNEKGERQVDRIEFAATPGRRAAVGRDDWGYTLEVIAIDPDWEMRSEAAEGAKAYSVNVQVRPTKVQSGAGASFVRQLIAGHPEHTEDVIFTGDQAQPMQRAKKALGKPLVDDAISLELDYQAQRWTYLRPELQKCWALYLRKPGASEWTERPIEGMPLYNDRVASRDQVFQNPGDPPLVPRPIDVEVKPVANDPFPDLTLRVTGYLRYAEAHTDFRAGGPSAPINPMVRLVISGASGRPTALMLEALNRNANTGDQGLLQFRYASTEEEFQRLARPPALRIRVPELGIDRREPLRDPALDRDAWLAVATDDGKETGYAYRVVQAEDDVQLATGIASVAILELKTPKGSYRRWAFDDARLNRDASEELLRDPHAAPVILDPSIDVTYEPGSGVSVLTLVAGPDPNRLRVILAAAGQSRLEEVQVGETLKLPANIALVIDRYESHGVRETKPFIVPEFERVRDAGIQLAQILIEAPNASSGGDSMWLPYHNYVFDSPLDVPRRQPYRPSLITLPNGTQAEVMFSRQREPLPAEVALEDFMLTTHVGGFTGETATIRDYTSMVRFRSDSKSSWSEPIAVSVNKPVEYGGYSYFQAQWDPPEEARADGGRASRGLNFTVLGVGNRHGVGTMLAGCCIAVAGMLYAFYVKPIIKRRKRDAAEASMKPKPSAAAHAVVALLTLFMLAASAPGAEPGFAQQVDLTPLGQIAVQGEGRIKSLGSHANSFMHIVSGPRKIADQDPLFTYMDMMLRSQAYDDADIIYVKNRQVREEMALALERGDASLAPRMAAFRKSGLISPKLLTSPSLANVYRGLEADVVRSARQMDELRSALAVSDARFLLSKLHLIPPADGSEDAQWHGIDEVMFVPGSTTLSDATLLSMGSAGTEGALMNGIPGIDLALQQQIADAWRSLVNAWLAQDATGVTNAATQLASALPRVAPDASVYPDQKRLAWEYWYFQKDQLTSIWLVYMGSVVLLLLGLIYRWTWARRLGIGVFGVAFVLQTLALALRWYISGRWPNSNMFEAVTTASWFGACAAIIIEVIARRTAMRSLFLLGSSVASMVALMTAHFLPVYLNPNISNVMPVLNDVWLYIHTNVIIFSYCLIFMAAVSAMCYVAWRLWGGSAVYAKVGGAGSLVLGSGGASSAGPQVGEILDGVTMVLMELAFILLWTGIVMGAIWADHSWGRPWGWDPKEVFALNTFVVFALLVHVRLKVKDKGMWTALLAIGGAAVMLFNWIVINFVITGLHSYA